MDKEYSLKVLPKAKSDMENTLDYIKDVLKSPQAASKHRKMFTEGLKKIKKSPKSFPHDEFESLYRWYLVGNYKIYYLEIDDKSQVVVFRVLYQGMDHPQHL